MSFKLYTCWGLLSQLGSIWLDQIGFEYSGELLKAQPQAILLQVSGMPQSIICRAQTPAKFGQVGPSRTVVTVHCVQMAKPVLLKEQDCQVKLPQGCQKGWQVWSRTLQNSRFDLHVIIRMAARSKLAFSTGSLLSKSARSPFWRRPSGPTPPQPLPVPA